LYPNDTRFIDGINEGAQLLLTWATKQHQNSQYATAIDRYDHILDAPGVDSTIKKETEIKRSYAVKGGGIPSADWLYNQAVANTTASGQFDLFERGYTLYPEDQRFLSGFNSSALNLFIWAIDQHESRRFEVAIQRYDKLLESPYVSESIKNIALKNRTQAMLNKIPTRQIVEYTGYSTSLLQALNIQMNLSTPPQTDDYRNEPGYIQSSFVDEIEIGAISGNGVNVRKTATLDGVVYANLAYGTAFEVIKTVSGDTTSGSNKWYQIKYNSETLYVHSSLVNITNGVKVTKTANIYETTNTGSHVYTTVKANELLLIENKGTNWFEVSIGTWRNAKTNDVLAMLNPDNNDMYQHLVLSTSAGVDESEINKLLSGKGILDGEGQTFINAGFENSVNEVYLISHALLESGNGTSTLANGIDVGINNAGNLELATTNNRSKLTNIKTTYNMFGIGAVDSDPERLGAFKAYEEEWYSPEAAIIGGAKFIGDRYIHNSYEQNTLYKMRWNPANPGYPQYATDIKWSVKQISNVKNLYDKLENPILEFDIPRYN
uniref:N-acetylglucosaminidase n=1 Tax=Paraliobacillus zengyii TaxID=2213194 RepID=UPI001300449F